MEQLQAQCSSRHLAPPQPTIATQEKTVQFSPDSYLQPVPTVSYSSPTLSTTAAEVGGVLTTTTAGGTAHTTMAVGGRSPMVGEGGVWEGGAGGGGEEEEGGCSHGGVRNGGVGSGGQWNPSLGVPTPTAPLMATHPPVVAQQLPPLAKFTGDSSGEGETVIEWLEQFQLVANACHWDESTKLVNLVTRLKGQAFAFYRSCDPRKRNNYLILAEELRKRFTPVHIQAVQSSLFHDRKQKPGEDVDTYAQDLKCLFYKAYPSAQQSTLEMQELMKSVLTNQFVCGLQPELKGKLAGRDGHFEQLFTIARFEEAKARELRQKEGTPMTPRKNSGPPARTLTKGGEPTRTTENQNPGTDTNMRCFDCGQRGHRARNCREREQRCNKETPAAGNRGRDPKKKFVSAPITREENSDSKESSEQRVEDLRRQLQEAEVELALEKQSATMRGVTCDEPGSETVQLGPTVYADLELEGCRVKALVDTGSPATIVSLDFLLNSLAKGRAREQTPTGWKLEVKHRIKPPEVMLRSYGGGGLDIVGQILVTLRCGLYSRTAVVLVQKQA